MKKRFIKFSWLPASWGLRGKSYEIAKAEYELEGDELLIKLAEIKHGEDSREYKVACLDAQKSNGKITDFEYQKSIANIDKEPWVAVVKIDTDKDTPSQLGEIELDWNEYFIEDLRKSGFDGVTEHQIIDSWFNLVCLTVAQESGLVSAEEYISSEKLGKDILKKPNKGKGKGKNNGK